MPQVDIIVRGEVEKIFQNLVHAVAEGRWPADRRAIKGLAFRDGDKIIATPAALPVKDLDAIDPDWSLLEGEKYTYMPLGVRVAIPNMARGCPFTCSFCSQWKFWRDYRKDASSFARALTGPNGLAAGSSKARFVSLPRRAFSCVTAGACSKLCGPELRNARHTFTQTRG